MNHSASEQFHRICQTTHHTITPMDFFAELFTSTTPEADPAPSAPVDAAGGGSGGCIVA
jgi:hypothetical protein